MFCVIEEVTGFTEDGEVVMIWFSVFHLLGMSSTCTNPILYGYLNKNIQKVIMQRLSGVADKIRYRFYSFYVSLI